MKKTLASCLIVFFFVVSGGLFAGEKAPGFKVEDVDGATVDSAEFLGSRPAVLVFWAQWCGYCRGELPKLAKLHEEYSKLGLKIVAFNRDGGDDKEIMHEYLEQNRFPFTVVSDSKRVHYAYKALTIPFLVLIDSNGEIVDRGFSLETIGVSLKRVLGELKSAS